MLGQSNAKKFEAVELSPSYLKLIKGMIEEIIDEIEALAPGAFHRTGFGGRGSEGKII